MRGPSKPSSRWLVLAVGVLLAGTAHEMHLRAVSGEQSLAEQGDKLFLPDGKLLRHFSFGQRTTLADIYWLKQIQYVGAGIPRGDRLPQLLALSHLITDLDLEYAYAYMFGGLILNARKRIDESNEILEKGAANVDRWEIPFYLSFNHWYELQDYPTGARWMKETLRRPGRPEYLGGLAARLFSSAGDVGAAIELAGAMAAQAPSEESRNEYRRKLEQLVLERDIQIIEREISAFREQHGRLPWGFGELDGRAWMRLARSVTLYQYDPLSGQVSTPLQEKRLKVTRPSDVSAEIISRPSGS